jgi:bifunctional non-homologous end joining protein LigD
MAQPESANIAVELEGRDVRLTNLDRVLWPRQGLTKGWLLQAYAKLAPALLSHLRGRPVTMWRYPAGVEGKGWWQNECRGAPEWVSRYRYTGKDGREHDHCVIDDLPSLLWLANLDTIEIHPFLFDVAAPEAPRALVFDLDPGEPAGLRDACRIGLRLRDALESQRLEAFAKTSGSKGLHIYVPLNTEAATFEETKAYARTLASFLTSEYPDEVVDRQARELRRGKVLVDWLQNDRFRSTVAPYSLRATPEATVSTPVTWEEVADVASGAPGASLEFGVEDVLARIEQRGDLFEPVERVEQRLVG